MTKGYAGCGLLWTGLMRPERIDVAVFFQKCRSLCTAKKKFATEASKEV